MLILLLCACTHALPRFNVASNNNDDGPRHYHNETQGEPGTKDHQHHALPPLPRNGTGAAGHQGRIMRRTVMAYLHVEDRNWHVPAHVSGKSRYCCKNERPVMGTWRKRPRVFNVILSLTPLPSPLPPAEQQQWLPHRRRNYKDNKL